MSVKQQFSEVIEALPETTTIEEAFERLYRAFRLKQMRSGGGHQGMAQPKHSTEVPEDNDVAWENLKERAKRQSALARQYPTEFVVLVEYEVVFHSPDRQEAEGAYQKALDRTDGKYPVLVSPDSQPPLDEPIFRGRSLAG